MKTDRSIRTHDDCRRPLFPAPIVVLIVILAKAFGYAKKGLGAVLVYIPAASDLSRWRGDGAVGRARRARLFLPGLVARTVTAQRVIDALKSSVLSKVPGTNI